MLRDEPDLVELAEEKGRKLHDVRVPSVDYPIATGVKRSGKRVLAVGTDCSVGKMYTALALDESMRTGIAHFWSRSRAKLWRKGEESGNTLRIEEMRTDCDQDVLWLRVRIEGDGKACHTDRRSCFYRRVTRNSDGSVALHIDECT